MEGQSHIDGVNGRTEFDASPYGEGVDERSIGGFLKIDVEIRELGIRGAETGIFCQLISIDIHIFWEGINDLEFQLINRRGLEPQMGDEGLSRARNHQGKMISLSLCR